MTLREGLLASGAGEGSRRHGGVSPLRDAETALPAVLTPPRGETRIPLRATVPAAGLVELGHGFLAT